MRSIEMTPAALAAADCVVILTNHRAFDYARIVATADLVVDTRNATGSVAPHVFRLGAPGKLKNAAAPVKGGAGAIA
jgi:UDP-N-acetyl-D-glucosamine dehydrogenase